MLIKSSLETEAQYAQGHMGGFSDAFLQLKISPPQRGWSGETELEQEEVVWISEI